MENNLDSVKWKFLSKSSSFHFITILYPLWNFTTKIFLTNLTVKHLQGLTIGGCLKMEHIQIFWITFMAFLSQRTYFTKVFSLKIRKTHIPLMRKDFLSTVSMFTSDNSKQASLVEKVNSSADKINSYFKVTGMKDLSSKDH